MDSGIINWVVGLLFVAVFFVWWLKPTVVQQWRRLKLRMKERKKVQAEEQQPQARKSTTTAPDNQSPPYASNTLLVLHIEAREGKDFSGARVIELLEAADLQSGAMRMYQYFVDYRGTEKVVFNVINGIEPGHLDQEFAEGTTPCITFFFALVESYNPRKSLDAMLRIADSIARELDGIVQDGDRSKLTEQTKQHLFDTVERYILHTPLSE